MQPQRNAPPDASLAALLLDIPTKPSPVALRLPDGLSYEVWELVGRDLGRADSALQWWLGDWWSYGFPRYGHRAHQCETWSGLHYRTLGKLRLSLPAIRILTTS